MDAKFYIKNLTNSSKQNSGEGNQNQEGSQNETDPIKIYLNQLATKSIEKGTSYFDILNIADLSPTIIDKISYTTLLQHSQANINPENKIGDENNYEFVIIEYPDNVNDYIGSPSEIYEHTKFIFINEENASYFLNKFIKVSTKQFIKSSLYSIDFKNSNVIFDDLDINAKNLEENIAINNFKFVIDIGAIETELIVTDDIDLQTFYTLKNTNEEKVKVVFDENENKIIFAAEHKRADGFYFILFRFSNNAAILTENINGTNYKIVGDYINA